MTTRPNLMPEHQMRTTLQLNDVLAAARVLARQQRTSLGAVISELARQALVAPAGANASSGAEPQHRNGLPLLPWKAEGAPVDLELVNGLLDQRHVHHEQAHGWFAASQDEAWATCPLAQNAVLRILGQLTDTYLLALAVHQGGPLLSFDRRLACEAVTGGRQALRLIDTALG